MLEDETKLDDYCNNMRSLVELTGIRESLYGKPTIIDEEIFFVELRKVALDNIKLVDDPTLSTTQFLKVLETSLHISVEKALIELCEQGLIERIVDKNGDVHYKAKTDSDLPDWFKNFEK